MKSVPIVLAAAALLAGCGLENPYADDEGRRVERPTTSATGSATTDAGDAQPGRAKPPEPLVPPAAGGGGSTPAEVASLYARAFSNWSWRNVARENGDVLAGLAAGEQRQLVLDNMRALREDTTLERDRAANRGEQLALDVQGADPVRRTVWIVLRETASTRGVSGVSDTTVTVYRATAARLDDGGWYVTSFEPQA